jgi:hypothetical protein
MRLKSVLDSISEPLYPEPQPFFLTKREWYAGMALQTLVMLHDGINGAFNADIAKSAFRYADSMLAAGEKK